MNVFIYYKFTHFYGGTPDHPVFIASEALELGKDGSYSYIGGGSIQYAHKAEKIWVQDETGAVKTIKDRDYKKQGPVEDYEGLEEFKLVKLSASLFT